jgi:hypothetical protein
MTEWSGLFSLHLACVARCWVLIILASVACLAEKHGRIADAPDPEFGSNVDSGASGAEESLSRLSFSPPGLSFGSAVHPPRARWILFSRRSADKFYVAGQLFSRLTSCHTESEVRFESDGSFPGAEALRHPRWLTHYALKSRTFSARCGAEQGRAPGQNIQAPSPSPQKDSNGPAHTESTLEKIRDLPIVWFIGPYIPSTRPLRPLTKAERSEVYFRQTLLTAGSYFARMFAAASTRYGELRTNGVAGCPVMDGGLDQGMASL